jgi:hypothetical protein
MFGRGVVDAWIQKEVQRQSKLLLVGIPSKAVRRREASLATARIHSPTDVNSESTNR